MQRIISREIEKTLDMKKLSSLLPKYCVVRKYDQIKGRTLKDVMGKYQCLIILWNVHDERHRVLNKPGHFFVLSTRGQEECVVFSSTGMTPKKELFLTQSDPTLFERILPKNTVYNNIKFQLTNSSNTCWRWCIVYVHLAAMGLKQFQSLFKHPRLHLTTGDELVTALTYLSLH
jgi:hypothetical protein